MSRTSVVVACFFCLVLSAFSAPALPAQSAKTPPPTPRPKTTTPAAQPDYSKEGVVFEKIATTYAYNADGTGSRTLEVSARVQSDAAVHDMGVLTFAYASRNEHVSIDDLRVLKPDGSVVTTPASDAQDMPTDVTRAAPFYSDLRELQIPVKSLSAGDRLQYRIRFDLTQPLADGQFWGAENWITSNVVLDQSVELSFPAGKFVQVLSPHSNPTITEANGRKVYRWHSSHLQPTSEKKPETDTDADTDAFASIAWTTFRSWQQIGDWYRSLAQSRTTITPEIQSKVQQLVQGLTTDDEKMEAIYNYVSLQVRYIGVAFGIGRYQPHTAQEVLGNQYGDCKDKTTLLITMLKAAGFDAWPALIGSTGKLHPELPSPAQFNHVITVVPRGSGVLWLDTTPEVAPWKMLLLPLRDKQALVIPVTGEPKLMRTPADGPFPFTTAYTATAKIDSDGTLTGHLSFVLRGDSEIVFRAAYRATPRAQWQQLTQNISQDLGYGGSVSNVDAGLPDRTSEPFHLAYDYTRKNYGDWSNHRILALMTGVPLPASGDTAKKIHLPAPQLQTFHSEIQLPPHYTAELPSSVQYETPFVTYETSYKIEGDKFITDRRLRILRQEIPAASWAQYKAFMDKVNADVSRWIQLDESQSSKPSEVASVAAPPDEGSSASPSADSAGAVAGQSATALIDAAYTEFEYGDYTAARRLLQQAQKADPTQPRLWRAFARLDESEQHLDNAELDYRKEIQLDSANKGAYEDLISLQLRFGKTDEAIGTLEKMLKAFPDDTQAEFKVSSLLVARKRFDENAALLEAAATRSPANRNLAVELGRADILAGKSDAGLAMMRSAARDADDPAVLARAARTLINSNLELTLAESICTRALNLAEQQTSAVSLANLGPDQVRHIKTVISLWDTMGWIYFREGKIHQAESYIRPAWRTAERSDAGEHLGEIYEKEGRLQNAADTYALAWTDSDPATKAAIAGRLHALAAKGYRSRTDIASIQLDALRSISLSLAATQDASARFFVLLSGGRALDTHFIGGDGQLRSSAELLRKADYSAQFPPQSKARLVFQGDLSCSRLTHKCRFTMSKPGSLTALSWAP